MTYSRWTFGAAFLAVSSLAWGCGTGSVRAQDSDQRLTAPEVSPGEKTQLLNLRDGRGEVSEADKRLLEKAAKWYIYRLTHKEFQERRPPDGTSVGTGQSTYDILQRDLYPLIAVPDPTKPPLTDNQIKFMQAFTRALLDPIRKVLVNPVPIARINAAIVLAKLSETQQEELADDLVKVIQDPEQLDAVKLYALRGLKTLLQGEPYLDRDVNEVRYKTGDTFGDRDREKRCILALIEFINRQPRFSGKPTPAEVNAYRYVRREAVRALGFSRYPAVADPRTHVISAPTAVVLTRVMRRSGLSPEPSVSEQMEAAIGICQLRAREYLSYNVETAANHIGWFVVDFADKYEQDRTKGAKGGRWRYDANRLITGLQTLGAESQSNAKVTQVVRRCTEVLRNIHGGTPTDVRGLRTWLDQNPPSDPRLYKGEETSAVRPSESTE
jgi:hypothetical protein